VLAFWVGYLWSPQAQQPVAASADPAVAAAKGPAAASTDRAISAAQLAAHARPDTCWMAIRGSVYDLAASLPAHPSPPQVIEPWCGKDATDAYNTKTKGRPHSNKADTLLLKYRIGRFVPGIP